MLGAIIGAGASLASTLLGKSASDKANKAQAAQAQQNYQQQKEFAQNGIQWKSEDAKKAGIHPLYAMGANTVSFSPTQVGSSTPDFSGIASAGQDIGRAVDANASAAQRVQLRLLDAQATGAELDNQIRRVDLSSKLATRTGTTTGPAFPDPATTRWLMDGQGNAPEMGAPKITTNTRRDAAEPGAPHSVAGAGPSVGFILNPNGGYSPVIPPELAESFEQDTIGGWDWQIRNRLGPNLGWGEKPNIPRPQGYEVYFEKKSQDWRTREKQFRIRNRYNR